MPAPTTTSRAAALHALRPDLDDPVAGTAAWARAALDEGLLDLPLPGLGCDEDVALVAALAHRRGGAHRDHPGPHQRPAALPGRWRVRRPLGRPRLTRAQSAGSQGTGSTRAEFT
jgi:hypothetical protein